MPLPLLAYEPISKMSLRVLFAVCLKIVAQKSPHPTHVQMKRQSVMGCLHACISTRGSTQDACVPQRALAPAPAFAHAAAFAHKEAVGIVRAAYQREQDRRQTTGKAGDPTCQPRRDAMPIFVDDDTSV